MTKITIQNKDALEAYEIIMEAIVTQKLLPSQKVSENILSDMFGLSRTISRNLIERLMAQQFLVSLSPRVTQVAPLTLMEIKQNFALRKILLPEIAAISGANIDFRQLNNLNDKLQNLLTAQDDQSALKFLKINKELNLTLCYPAQYPLMREWIGQLEDMAMRIYWLYIKTTNSFPYSNEQQKMTFDIMKSDDPRKIQKSLHDMINQTEDRILNAIFTHEQFYTQDLLV